MDTRFKFPFYFKELLIWRKYADPDKYIYSGYGIGFDSRSEFLLATVA